VIDLVRARLEELLAALGGRRVSIVPAGGGPPPLGAGGVRTLPLGAGARLEVELGAIGRASDEVDRALEEAVRDLRELARASRAPWSAVSVASAGPVRIRDRVRAYLGALAELHGARTALVTVRDAVVAASSEPDPHEHARLPLLVRRLEAAAARRGSSHGELADDDVFAVSFWHRAALVVFFADAYPVDFVRHRARLVARELAELLPDLEPDPGAPAMVLRPPS
jgi:hypothetical protein